jgi:hypothetical protein
MVTIIKYRPVYICLLFYDLVVEREHEQLVRLGKDKLRGRVFVQRLMYM